MAAKAQMVRWGNSLAVRIPKSLAEEAKLKEGDTLTLEVETQGIVSLKAVNRPKSLADLVAQITPQNLHQEENWGERAGAEKW